jgi:hypothetical protein
MNKISIVAAGLFASVALTVAPAAAQTQSAQDFVNKVARTCSKCRRVRSLSQSRQMPTPKGLPLLSFICVFNIHPQGHPEQRAIEWGSKLGSKEAAAIFIAQVSGTGTRAIS